MDPIRITTVQSRLSWENPAANLDHFDHLLKGLEGDTDLVILPEMFSTGFTMNAESLAEGMDGPAVQWMRRQSERLSAVVCGSLIIREGGHNFNRFIWAAPDRHLFTYDKRHLFSLAGEEKFYSGGKNRLVIEWKGWKVCPLICYDLRFPVWSRNTVSFDLLIYVANWPEKRSHAWRTLLEARAIENQCFTIGVNRVGRDGNGHLYCGDTSVVDYNGRLYYRASHIEQVATHQLTGDGQKDFRRQFAFLEDRDHFSLEGRTTGQKRM